MKLNQMLLAGAALFAAGGAQAQTVVSYDFNNYANGTSQAAQAGTGLPVFAFGDLPGFTKSGQNAVHAVQRGAGNYAVMFYNGDAPAQANGIVANAGVAANTLGQAYQVSFLSAFGVYNNASQITRAGDGLLFRLLDGTNAAVASFTYSPTGTAFTPSSFSYVGTGSGVVRLSVTGVGNSGEFGGALDDVTIAAVPEPAAWAMMIVGMGAVGVALRRRVRASEDRFDARIKGIAEGAIA